MFLLKSSQGKRIFTAILITLCITATTQAQQVWLSESSFENSVSLEINKPVFSDFAGFFDNSPFSSFYFLNGQLKLNDNLLLVTDVPISFTSIRNRFTNDERQTEAALGNIYTGIRYRFGEKDGFDPSLQFGLRLPTAADSDFNDVGLFAGNTGETDRISAFFSNVIPIHLDLNLDKTVNEVLQFRFRPGIQYWVVTEDGGFNPDDQVFVNYSAQMLFDAKVFKGYAGISGFRNLRGERERLTNRDISQFRTGIVKESGNLEYDLFLRTPLRPEFGLVDYGIGVGVRYKIRK